MKKIIIILFLSIGTTLTGQIEYTGSIKYSLVDMDTSQMYFKSLYDFVPSSMTSYFYQGDVAQDMEGGFFDMARYLFKKDKKEVIILVDTAKVYTKVGLESITKRTTEKMNEQKTILGKVCEKYKVTVTSESNNYDYFVWLDMSWKLGSSEILEMYGNEFFLKEIPYAMLRVETMAGLNYEATEISTEIPNIKLFGVPKGYKLEKKLFRKADNKKDKK